jgi:gamma-glutamyl phosphate reductase
MTGAAISTNYFKNKRFKAEMTASAVYVNTNKLLTI